MPSMPIVLALCFSLQAALQRISTAGGYFYDVKPSSVVLDAQNLTGVNLTDVPFLVVGHQVEPVTRDFNSSRPVAVKDRWRFMLAGRVDAPGFDTSVKQTALSQFEADIEKALTVDPQRLDLNTLTGGVCQQALYTYVGQGTRYMGEPDQAMCFLEMPVEVLLQRTYGQA